MKYVPCINCLKIVKVNDKRIVATLCDNCKTQENIKRLGKNFDTKELQKVLNSTTKFKTNEYGEPI